MKSKKFFTKYNYKHDEKFMSEEEALLVTCEYDLIKQGKKTQYKGVKKYDYRDISLYPFNSHIEFTLNSMNNLEQKKRLQILTKGKTVGLVGIYSDMRRKENIFQRNNFNYKSCAVGSFFSHTGVCKKQRGLRGSIGNHYYNCSDKDLIKFFESRGYITKYLRDNQPDYIAFTLTVNNEDDANKMYDDLYEFDKKYYK